MLNACLVVFIDRHHGRVYRYQPATRQLDLLEEVFDAVPKSVRAASWKGLADDKVARHVEEHVHEHLKRVAAAIQGQATVPGQAVFLAGQDTSVAEFAGLLADQYAIEIAGQFQADAKAPVHDLAERFQPVYYAWRDETVAAILRQIEESRQPAGRGVVSREPVLEALTLKQVQALVLADDTVYAGYVCAKDGYASTSMATCPACQQTLMLNADARAALTDLAQRQAAQVYTVAPALLPADYEGLAALRRYR